LKTHHLAFSLSLLLGGCASRPAIVPADSAAIDLAPVTLAEAEPAVRESCERSIQQALLRHGFMVDPAGLRVEVEVSFWQDSGLGASGAYGGDLGVTSDLRTSGSIAPATQQTGYTADLTATLRLTPAPRTVLTSGTASYTRQLQDLRPTGGPSRISACAIAAERFAEAMVEVVNNASR
jgi:hypothetical protein